MKKNNLKKIILVFKIVLVTLFVYSAIIKIIDPKSFADAVAGFKLLPLWSVNIFALILPWVELFGGLALLNKTTVKGAGLVIIILNLVFIIAAFYAMARGLNIDCGCFGIAEKSKVGWELIIRDIILVVMAFFVVLEKSDFTIKKT